MSRSSRGGLLVPAAWKTPSSSLFFFFNSNNNDSSNYHSIVVSKTTLTTTRSSLSLLLLGLVFSCIVPATWAQQQQPFLSSSFFSNNPLLSFFLTENNGNGEATTIVPTVHWEALQLNLFAALPQSEARSDVPLLVTPTFDNWKEQCVDPFVVPFLQATTLGAGLVSNWRLLNQPDGTCLAAVSCIFDNCIFPTFPVPFQFVRQSPYAFADNADLSFLEQDPERFRLPMRTLNPRFVFDIVQAVQFSQANNIPISVKVGGSSYFGASTGPGLLIKMSPAYPKYAIEGRGLVECPDQVGSANNATHPDDSLCPLARARGKQAYLRVGGGEFFDEAYRAVSFDWNRQFDNNPTLGNLYHLLGGAAGTVSAAGGWMASGGLSGFTGMRLFGMGIDQVLQVEMVLPNGQHVRFGPTEWTTTDPNQLYPQTTLVTGYCNVNPETPDESLWEWIECNDATELVGDVSFDDLWFAVRGGGGGTWGIVTSVYYHLHDYPGVYQYVEVDSTDFFLPSNVGDIPAQVQQVETLLSVYIEFVLRFLYRPSTLNVTTDDSNRCSSSTSASFAMRGYFICYGTAGNVLVETWQQWLTVVQTRLVQVGFTEEELTTGIPQIFNVSFERPSHADNFVATADDEPVYPEGRLRDLARTALVPILPSFPEYADSRNTLFSLELVQDSTETTFMQLVTVMAEEVRFDPGPSSLFYSLGGKIPWASDGRNSLSPARRNVAFMKSVPSERYRNIYFELIYGALNETTDDFPGSSCHNHALLYDMGPLKADWTRVCPLSMPQTTRDELCISFDEATWGSANVRELTRIKALVDPNGLFVCPGSIGSPRVPFERTRQLGGLIQFFTAALLVLLTFACAFF